MTSEDDNSVLLCSPSDKLSYEARNGAEQLEYITHLVGDGVKRLGESHIRQLQQIAIRDIYPCGGRYRDARKRVEITNSDHTLPEAAFVSSMVVEAVSFINEYIEALRKMDALVKVAAEDVVDVKPMSDFLRKMLVRQLASVVNDLDTPRPSPAVTA